MTGSGRGVQLAPISTSAAAGSRRPQVSSVQFAHERGNQWVAGVNKRFTSSGYLVRDGKVLLVNHRRYRLWLPIGGHIEPDEDPLDTLYREAREKKPASK